MRGKHTKSGERTGERMPSLPPVRFHTYARVPTRLDLLSGVVSDPANAHRRKLEAKQAGRRETHDPLRSTLLIDEYQRSTGLDMLSGVASDRANANRRKSEDVR